jgi:hypothetical protein
MSIDKSIKSIINDSIGVRVGDRNFLPAKLESLFDESIKNDLRSQCGAAGRDAARIFVKLDESDGSSIYVTGWDGNSKFVGQDISGFGYIESSRIQTAKIDEKWDNQLTLGHIRKNLEEMDRNQVADLVGRLKKCLIKRSKDRRQSEVKNFVRRFQKACAADKKAEPAVTEQKDDNKKKLDKKGEYSWHTKGNRSVPVKEEFKSFLSRFKHMSESFPDKSLMLKPHSEKKE